MEMKERLERLGELKHLMENHDELIGKPEKVAFNMNFWRTKRERLGLTVEIPESCGTAACALGSACLYKPFMEKGLKTEAYDQGIYKPALTGYNSPINDYCNSGVYVGAEFFGISHKEAEFLFSPLQYTDKYLFSELARRFQKRVVKRIRPKQVARRIDILMQRYKHGCGEMKD